MPVKIFLNGKKNGSNRLLHYQVFSTFENPKLKIDANFMWNLILQNKINTYYKISNCQIPFIL
jgi:hypothetical protein